jgi:flagella basal body P-ring formation protein FlgA
MKPILPALVLFALPAFTAAAQAAPFADLSVIDAEVARFTGAGPGQPGGASLPVDRRLRLAACRQALALGWNGARRDSVVVQCPDAGGWRIFVPVTVGSAAPSAAPLVTRGDAVTIEAAGEGFSVAQPGEALESGAAGAWIRVRPAGKGEPFRAQVVRPGLVSVPVR